MLEGNYHIFARFSLADRAKRTDGVRDSWEFEMTEFMIKTLGIEYWSKFRKKKEQKERKRNRGSRMLTKAQYSLLYSFVFAFFAEFCESCQSTFSLNFFEYFL